MTALPIQQDQIDLPEGATIRRPDPNRPFVAMSNRKRWSKCALSAVLPQVRTASGPAAEEGTEAHKVAEWSLDRAFNNTLVDCPVVYPPQGLENFDYSPAGVSNWRHQVWQYAQTYAAKAASLFADCTTPTTCLVEHKIEDVTIHGVRVFTVADVVLWNPEAKRLVVGDYKFGRGPVGIGARDEPNEQVAGALALMLDPGHFGAQAEMAGGFVYQPRTYAGEPWQVLAPLSIEWLYSQRAKLHDELRAVAAAAKDPEGTAPVPGDHCKYCPSARWCPAASGYGAKALEVEAGRVAVVDLAPEEVMALWGARSAFKAFEDDLRERVQMLAQVASPAVTVRRRAGNSVWKNPDAIVELLMVHDKASALQPPGINAVKGLGIPAELIDPHVTRAPDVLTYLPAAGKDNALAASAFAKYLPKESD